MSSDTPKPSEQDTSNSPDNPIEETPATTGRSAESSQETPPAEPAPQPVIAPDTTTAQEPTTPTASAESLEAETEETVSPSTESIPETPPAASPPEPEPSAESPIAEAPTSNPDESENPAVEALETASPTAESSTETPAVESAPEPEPVPETVKTEDMTSSTETPAEESDTVTVSATVESSTETPVAISAPQPETVTEPTLSEHSTPASVPERSPESSVTSESQNQPTESQTEAKGESLREKLKQAQTAEEARAVPSEQPDVSPKVDPTQAPTGPVAIPRDAEDFDAEMEAEIEAALASGEIGESPAQSPTPETSEPAASSAEAEPVPQSEEELVEGMLLTATIQSIDEENVFLDLGFRSNGIVSRRQFNEKTMPQPGAKIGVRVDRFEAEEGLIHVNLPHGKKKVTGNWAELAIGQVVDATVNKTNKGGLEVTVGSLRGFMPAGQVDLVYHSDLEPFVGRKLQSTILEVNEKKRNLVVSHKAFLEVERAEKSKTLWEDLAMGQSRTGYVKNLKDYGAFIDIGGADGFLHIGEMSWQHIKHPKELLKEGQQVEVQIISLEPERSRIGLSLKALQQDPWMLAAETYLPGTTTRGTVTRTTKFGAFVKLGDVEGLVHISELDHTRVGRVTDVVKVGQEIEVKVMNVDPDSRRMSLSIKELTPAPEPVQSEAPSEEDYQRKRKGPLKGGIGGSKKGGLFGDPSDFN